ncbi:ORC2-domain-containing protein [Lactarius psammicola]|nr:ORC2-domain-containing protein [Lactarius psammicola]
MYVRFSLYDHLVFIEDLMNDGGLGSRRDARCTYFSQSPSALLKVNMSSYLSSDQDSEFYSDFENSPSKGRTRSSSRASDFTTDDNPDDGPGSFTSFDAYFLHASRPSRTSSNVFSQLVQPLSPDEFTTSLPRAFYPLPFSDASTRLLEQSHRPHLPRYLLELAEGFNLLFYGLGSKRRVLNELARACATRARAHVLVLNAFQPSFSTRDILTALAQLPGEPQGVEGVAQFLSGQTSSSGRRRHRRLVLVVHNIDAPALRGTSKARTLLGALGALGGVQVAASVDHIVSAPLLWSSTEMLARRWLWHDLTTLAPYDAELASADPASLRAAAPTASRGGVGLGAGAEGIGAVAAGTGVGVSAGAGQMTETAAVHVLAAVTQRARKLFVLMGRRQLEALVDAGNVEPTNLADSGEVAIAYDVLFNLARDNFIATNDTALRALLGEFRDHRLVVTIGTGAMGTGETLWIPLRKERLKKLLDGLQQQDPP